MKQVIRRSCFETNSSSVHSITMCSHDDWDKWIDEEMVWDRDTEKLVEISPEIEDYINQSKNGLQSWRYLSWEQFNDYAYLPFETYHEEYYTAKGEIVHAFGYHGMD